MARLDELGRALALQHDPRCWLLDEAARACALRQTEGLVSHSADRNDGLMEEGVWYPAQWTRDLTKKRKVKHDGFVKFHEANAWLCGEDRQVLAGPVARESIRPGDGNLSCFAGFLVDVDDAPAGGRGQAGTASTSAPTAGQLGGPSRGRVRQCPAVGSRGFKAPRMAPSAPNPDVPRPGQDAAAWPRQPALRAAAVGLADRRDAPSRKMGSWGSLLTSIASAAAAEPARTPSSAPGAQAGKPRAATWSRFEQGEAEVDWAARVQEASARNPEAAQRWAADPPPGADGSDGGPAPAALPGPDRAVVHKQGAMAAQDGRHLAAGEGRGRSGPPKPVARRGAEEGEEDGSGSEEDVPLLQRLPPGPPKPTRPVAPLRRQSTSAMTQRTGTLADVWRTPGDSPRHAAEPLRAQENVDTPKLAVGKVASSSQSNARVVPTEVVWNGPDASGAAGRYAGVPARFATLGQLQAAFTGALMEEASLQVADMGKRFATVCARAGQAQGASLEFMCRRAGVPYYSRAQLSVHRPSQRSASEYFKPKGKKAASRDDGSDEEGARSAQTRYFLTLESTLERASAFKKGDVWVLASTERPQVAQQGQLALGGVSRPWTIVVKALWHGPTREGKMEVEMPSTRLPPLGKGCKVFALRGASGPTELIAAAELQGAPAQRHPALSHLLGPPVPADRLTSVPSAEREPSAAADEPAVLLGLNEEQREVLQHAVSWFNPEKAQRRSPVCLVHGPFGTGKSTLLGAIIRLLVGQTQPAAAAPGTKAGPAARQPPSGRVLVVAHTNVAVDRVLLGLKDGGFERFLRVGSVARVNKRLLRHCLHCADSRNSNTADELQAMLRETTNPAEVAAIREELELVRRGVERERKKLLKTVPVVGVTCCSSVLPVLDDLRFDVVVLDEASQMIEPISLLPIMRSGCKYVICAGDPCQLPPVVASPAALSQAPRGKENGEARGSASDPAHGSLARPMFVRLTQCGHQPHLLRRQYRCHPAIAAVPNRHFYDGQLHDGCQDSDRPPLVPGLAPVTCVDVQGREQQDAGHSTFNEAEARVVVRALKWLKERGVDLGRCGVICFFRAQVREVGRVAAEEGLFVSRAEGEAGDAEEGREMADGALQVATVDAFQGAERDVVLLSTATTRASSTFASDAQRLNVALTRAWHHLIVVGCCQALGGMCPALRDLLRQARACPGGYCPRGVFPPPRVQHMCMQADDEGGDDDWGGG